MPLARHWRVVAQQTNANIWFVLAEVTFFDASGADISVGGVSASSAVFGSDYGADKAFDKDLSVSSRWVSTAFPAWIAYSNPAPVAPVAVRIVCDNNPGNADNALPRGDEDVSIEYSIDGNVWHRTGWSRDAGDWHNGSTVEISIRQDAVLAVAAPSAMAVAVMPRADFGLHMHRTGPAIDMQYGGTGEIFGTTKSKASPENLPTKARVVLLHQRSKMLVRATWSDPDTGDYSFDGLDLRQEFLALAEDAAGNFRAVAAQRLLPGATP